MHSHTHTRTHMTATQVCCKSQTLSSNVFTTALHHMFYILCSFKICIFFLLLHLAFTLPFAALRPIFVVCHRRQQRVATSFVAFSNSIVLNWDRCFVLHIQTHSRGRYVGKGAFLPQCLLATSQHVGEVLITLRICILRLLERRRVKSKFRWNFIVACGGASCLHLNLVKTQQWLTVWKWQHAFVMAAPAQFSYLKSSLWRIALPEQ